MSALPRLQVIWDSEPDEDAEELLLRALEMLLPDDSRPLHDAILDDSVPAYDKEDAS